MNEKKAPDQSGKTVFSGKKATNEYDAIPKVKNKSYEEIAAVSVIELPKNQVKPVNGRIFVQAQDPGEQKTEGGIIIPTSTNRPDAKGGKERKLQRFFVIDVADDCNIKINGRKIERGDEIYPFIPQEAESWSFPQTFDWYTMKWYTVIHDTEVSGVGISPLLSKEDK